LIERVLGTLRLLLTLLEQRTRGGRMDAAMDILEAVERRLGIYEWMKR
jgi:hypothetical protein